MKFTKATWLLAAFLLTLAGLCAQSLQSALVLQHPELAMRLGDGLARRRRPRRRRRGR